VRRSWSIIMVCAFVLSLVPGALWPAAVLAVDPAGTPTPGVDLSSNPAYRNDSAPDQPILLRQAAFSAFESDVQQAFGNVQDRRVGSREVLRLAPSFKAQPGSTLDLVLTQSSTPSRADVGVAPRLAELKSREGAQEYDLPAGQDFGAVVVYAREKDAILGIARLEARTACTEIPGRGRLSLLDPGSAPTTCLGINSIDQLNFTGTPPKNLDIDAYRLVVKGLVDNPLSLSYDDLKKLPATSDVPLLICSGVFADVAEWTGVSLSTVLEQARVKPDWKSVRLNSVDGYFSILDRGTFKPEDVLLAYQVNGEPLPARQGFPVRVTIKGDYGSKWVKWLGSVQVLDKSLSE
jgi:hypothetical protein